MGKEIELKLVLGDGGAALVEGDPLLGGLKPRRAHQVSVYYDTPKKTLARKGYSFRVRTIGGKSVQTLKRASGSDGLFSRDEWEWDVSSEQPDLNKLKPLADDLSFAADKLKRKLGPTVRSEVDRTSWRLANGESELQLDLDVGTVSAGDLTEQFVELEFELLSGSATELIAVARSMAGRLPARLGVLSKAQRSDALETRRGNGFVKAAPVSVNPEMTVAEAFGTIAHACVKHYRLNEDAVIQERLAEALHQTRVAMRRLRSAFTFFRPAISDDQYLRLREELRWFTGQLGEARNLDVYLGRDLPADERDATLKRREEAYDHVVEAMNSSRFRLLLIDLVGWLALGEWKSRPASQKSICAYAGKKLDKLWGTIEPTGRSLARMDEECRHELRIQVKKMRYAIEFFDQLYRTTARKKMFSGAVEGLQEGLGRLNDLVTARGLVRAENSDWWRDQSEEVEHLREAEACLKRLGRAGPFWRGATQVSK